MKQILLKLTATGVTMITAKAIGNPEDLQSYFVTVNQWYLLQGQRDECTPEIVLET